MDDDEQIAEVAEILVDALQDIPWCDECGCPVSDCRCEEDAPPGGGET